MAEEYREKRKSAASAFQESRPQPHDLEVERAILSSMLREPETGVDIAIEHLGDSSEVFYSHVHRLIYSAVCELHESREYKVDLVSLTNLLKKKKQLDSVGGALFLAELHDAVPTTVRLDSWCNIARQYSVLRRMIDVCSESIARCYDPEAAVAELIEKIEFDIYNVRSSELKSSIVKLTDMLESEFDTLQDILDKKIEVGINTGYAALDNYTGGLKKGEMFVVAARPSIGKTSLALNIIRNIILPSDNNPKPRKVAFFSLEMTAEQITRRLLCNLAGVSESSFWNNTFNRNELNRLTKAVEQLENGETLFIDPTGGISIDELRAKARLMKIRDNIDIVVIDYLQLMRGRSRDNRQQEVAEISGGIKALAKELKIPILVLAQLNREVDKTAGASSKPKLSHLRESGSIEQDADVVTFLHRNRDDAKSVKEGECVEAFLIIEKNRNGRTGELKLNFFPSRMEFAMAPPYSPEDNPASLEKSNFK